MSKPRPELPDFHALSGWRGVDTIRNDPRYRHWAAIAGFYQEMAGYPVVDPGGLERIVVDPQGGNLAEIVELCSADGAPTPRAVASATAAIEQARNVDAHAILFVAPRHLLNNATVAAICRDVQTPWGLVTGRDPMAIAFALLKQELARRLPPGPAIRLDFVGDSMVTITDDEPNGGEPCVSSLPAEQLVRVLESPTNGLLVAHCHGDGAHGNFGKVVLCGLCDDIERLTDGRTGACRRDKGGALICKRNAEQLRVPLCCSDVAFPAVCLLTCNGSSVANEGYPSDSSFVLSFLEGFPSAVVTADRRIPFRPSDVEHVGIVLSRGLPFGNAVRLLNDWWSARHNLRPFVLFGDPRTTFTERAGRLGTSIPEPTTSTSRRSQCAGTDATPVARTGVGNRVTTLASRLSLHEAALATCAMLTRECDEAAQAVEAHARILRLVRHHLGLGWELATAPYPAGIHETDLWMRTLAALVGEVDRSIVDLIHNYVPQREVHLLFSSGLARTDRNGEGTCSFCGADLRTEEHSAPFVAPGYFVTRACPYCGPETAWDQDGRLVAMTAPRTAHPGEFLQVALTVRRLSTFPRAISPNPIVSLRFRDVGKSHDLDIDGTGIGSLPQMAMLTLPADTTLEVNTLRVIVAHELSLGLQRAAVAVLPR